MQVDARQANGPTTVILLRAGYKTTVVDFLRISSHSLDVKGINLHTHLLHCVCYSVYVRGEGLEGTTADGHMIPDDLDLMLHSGHMGIRVVKA